jgi:hypothetical protein
MLLLQKELSINQKELYKQAEILIQTEKEIFTVISSHKHFPVIEELTINNHNVVIEYGDPIIVTICEEKCYKMSITYDFSVQMIVSISYE